MDFDVDEMPLSLQASGERKRALAERIRSALPVVEYFLSGDVQLTIEWLVRECDRYQSHLAPDIDNILKPLIDVLSGPEGILIDDCQVQTVSCSWIDWTKDAHRVHFRVDYDPDEYMSKRGLVFVRVRDNLCLPMHLQQDTDLARVLVRHLRAAYELSEKLVLLGVGQEDAEYILPAQRIFHSARLVRYRILSPEEFLEESTNAT